MLQSCRRAIGRSMTCRVWSLIYREREGEGKGEGERERERLPSKWAGCGSTFVITSLLASWNLAAAVPANVAGSRSSSKCSPRWGLHAASQSHGPVHMLSHSTPRRLCRISLVDTGINVRHSWTEDRLCKVLARCMDPLRCIKNIENGHQLQRGR